MHKTKGSISSSGWAPLNWTFPLLLLLETEFYSCACSMTRSLGHIGIKFRTKASYRSLNTRRKLTVGADPVQGYTSGGIFIAELK
ncbi:hypothetical protein BDV38DRAFT_236621 [Aspergillus pseudotamarii]|uniref:Secreted protein n=1 Tax=Aspergillus pseudotamarii TaxID=132259 RepID=A0A5N6T6P2_ASPPS|nr:uncharacterized protein BDV38DRAFT_236621 [Aspergillus pseudotamarii]KAE8141916.1 hypothetical protein BDV38DRAFT_236621 [Aspergillus pseudotamarii]